MPATAGASQRHERRDGCGRLGSPRDSNALNNNPDARRPRAQAQQRHGGQHATGDAEPRPRHRCRRQAHRHHAARAWICNSAPEAEIAKLPGINKHRSGRDEAAVLMRLTQATARKNASETEPAMRQEETKTPCRLSQTAAQATRPLRRMHRRQAAANHMSRILLVDDSPHAQRMGERILSEEGYEVVTVSNADSALIRLDDVDPDVVLADTVMPGRTGYEICQYLKMSPRHRHVRVILTAGVLEDFDEEQRAAGGGRRHAEEAVRSQRAAGGGEAAGGSRGQGRGIRRPGAREPGGRRRRAPVAAPFVAVVDAEQVRAAVTVALDAAMEPWWTRSRAACWRPCSIASRRGPRARTGIRRRPRPPPQPPSRRPRRAAPPAPAAADPGLEPVRRVKPAAHPLRLPFSASTSAARILRASPIAGLDLRNNLCPTTAST